MDNSLRDTSFTLIVARALNNKKAATLLKSARSVVAYFKKPFEVSS